MQNMQNMQNIEINIADKRKFYLKRRNFIRRIVLVFLVFLSGFIFFRIYNLPKHHSVKIEFYGNKLINNVLLQSQLYSYIENRNFYLISPRNLTSYIVKTFPLIEDIAIRKYVFPEIKLIVSFKEKQVWGKIYSSGNSPNDYVTNQGDTISLGQINLDNLPSNILNIYLEKDYVLTVSFLSLLKTFIDEIYKNKWIKISEIKLNKKNEIELVSSMSLNPMLKIKVGQIQNEMKIKLQRLDNVIMLVNENDYCVEYLDLNYDGSAVIKTCSDKNKNKKSKFKIFKN